MSRAKPSIRATLNAQLSSYTIVDPFVLRKQSLRDKLEGRVTSWFTLLHIANNFRGFSKADAPARMIASYEQLVHAVQLRDELEVSRLVSVPQFELFEAMLVRRAALPFTLHSPVESARLVSARSFRREGSATTLSTWYQLYFQLHAMTGGERHEQLVVVERREADFDLRTENWRFAHFEDEPSLKSQEKK